MFFLLMVTTMIDRCRWFQLCLLLAAVLLVPANLQGQGPSPDVMEKAVRVAANDFIHHERRLSSSGDVFCVGVGIDHNHNNILGISVIDEPSENYPVWVSPKDTNCVLRYSDEDMYWLDPSSGDTVIFSKNVFNDFPIELRYSESDVVFNLRSLPDRMFIVDGKVFVWGDKSDGNHDEVMKELVKRSKVDFIMEGVWPDWWAIDDGEEAVCYDFERLSRGKVKKYHSFGIAGKGLRGRINVLKYKLFYSHR